MATSISPAGGGGGGGGNSGVLGLPASGAYARLRLIASGTFTAGASPANDWSVQFDDSGIGPVALPSVSGEFLVVETACGTCVDYAIWLTNPSDVSVYVEASAGAPLQIHVNGQITEVTAAGVQVLNLAGGFNLIRFIRAPAPVVAIGEVWDSKNARWVSLYQAGRDPFGASGALASVGTAVSTATGATPL